MSVLMVAPALTVADIMVLVAEMRTRHLMSIQRRDTTAMGIEGGVTLLAAVQAHAARLDRPCRVADLGSGLSSALLRALAPHLGLEVWTVDTEWKWLGTTLYELEREGLGTEHCHHMDIVESLGKRLKGHFDVLFVDCGNMAYRLELAQRGRLDFWLAPGGLMLLDDWHTEHYHPTMTALLEKQGFVVKPCRGSKDVHGRFLAEARRAP